MGLGNGDLGAGRSEASKDIAESPARSERPKKTKDKSLMTKVFCRDAKILRCLDEVF